MNKASNRRQFLYKKSKLKHRLQQDVMEDGVAHIPCKVSNIDDILSKFSIPGNESLDMEFLEYVMDYIEFVPPEVPVVLDIYGPDFTASEKQTIATVIETEMAYTLGRIEALLWRRRKIFYIMIVGLFFSGILFTYAKRYFDDLPLEFTYVIFWLFADAVVRYLFIENLDYRELKVHAGRSASLKVEFKSADKVS